MGTLDKPPSYDDGDMGLDLDDDEDFGSGKTDSPSIARKKETSSPSLRPSSAKQSQSPSKVSAIPKPSPSKISTPSKIAKPVAKVGRSPSQSSLKQPSSSSSSSPSPSQISLSQKPTPVPFDDDLDSYEDEDDGVRTKIKATEDKNQEIERLEQLTQQLLQQLEDKDKQMVQILHDINLDEVDELNDSAAKIKIASLAKKNKTLSLALEKEKTRNAKLQAEVKLQAEGVTQPQQQQKPKPPPPSSSFAKSAKPQLQTSPSITSGSEEKELQELRDANAKVIRQYSDAKDKLQAAQNEIKNLRRVLQREVGDNVDLNKLIEDNSSSWKGRAQQIAVLKARINEISLNGDKTKSPSIDNAHREEIAQIAADRRQEFDKVLQENEELREEFQRQKLKIEAKESRIKILEAKNHDFQEKMKIVLDKSVDDDQLIVLLKKEINKLKTRAGLL